MKAKNSAGYSLLSLYIVGLSVFTFILLIPDSVNIYGVIDTFHRCCTDPDGLNNSKCKFIDSVDRCNGITGFIEYCNSFRPYIRINFHFILI